MTSFFAKHLKDGRSGVYRLDSVPDRAVLAREAEAAGLRWFHVECREVASKEMLLRAIGKALSFPDYFGQNWDALEECLTDLSWAPAAGYCILLDHLELLATSAPHDLETALEIFRAVARQWQDRGTRFLILASYTPQQEMK